MPTSQITRFRQETKIVRNTSESLTVGITVYHFMHEEREVMARAIIFETLCLYRGVSSKALPMAMLTWMGMRKRRTASNYHTSHEQAFGPGKFEG